MNILTGYLLFAGRGVGGAQFAVGSELIVEVQEVDLIATGEVEEAVVLFAAEEATITVEVETVDIIVTDQTEGLTVE